MVINTLPILDTQKMTNSLLVNVDIPIDTKRLVRISLYPSKIDLEIDTKQQWRANMINIYQNISKWQFKWTIIIICGLLICKCMPTRFWKCAVSACCDPTIRIVGCSPMISMIPSGHQPWQWNNQPGISQVAMFDYQRVYQPRGVGCHRVSYISSLSMTGLGGAHDITTMVQHVWTSSPDKNTRAGTKKWSGPTMTAASKNNDVEANVSTHFAGHSFHVFQHKIYEQMDSHGIGFQ